MHGSVWEGKKGSGIETTQVLVTQEYITCSFLCIAAMNTMSNSSVGEERAFWLRLLGHSPLLREVSQGFKQNLEAETMGELDQSTRTNHF